MTHCTVQPGQTIYLRVTIKLVDGYSGSDPFLALIPQDWSYSTPSNMFGSGFTSSNIALAKTTTRPSNWVSGSYVTNTHSLTNVTGTTQIVMAGLVSDSSNMSEGWYQKPDQIRVTSVRGAKNQDYMRIADWSSVPVQGDSATASITRLGGRIK